ncbi:hypothetical protein V1520DRAFT_392535 [Lipomyces starkeyi]|uniref:Uncharacterized protein n=1 Tax=Lipomyces starkeyi NRRL Y-11557 TaxID=675824 RepID=A0A1E3PVT0_LIPST|nr:hypothetical protein LIPSTDRAFT_75777 [Lipomyces starkeyi NRRL Y-11557]
MSTAPTSASIPIQEFRAKLQEAVEARGASYHSIKVFIFRFEDDDTGADKDANTFSGCMRDVFGIDDVEDFAIEKTSKFPGFDIHNRILAEAKQLLGVRSLLIIVYIGHAVIDTESNRLQLISENGKQKLLWNMIHEPFLASTDDSLQNVDVLAVLDCCYAGSAVRAGGNRSVQLLAACDDGSTVRSRKDGVTFTQRLRRAAYALQNAGKVLVSVETLYGELQRSKPPTAPDTVHKIIGSARPLVLPLKHRSPSSLGHSVPCGNETTVLFKFSLAGGPNDVVLSEFQQLTKTIPGEFKVTIENAYESNSVVFLCRSSWETFARLRSTLDCVFIASIKGASLVHGEPQKSSTRSFGDLVDNRQADQVA